MKLHDEIDESHQNNFTINKVKYFLISLWYYRIIKNSIIFHDNQPMFPGNYLTQFLETLKQVKYSSSWHKLFFGSACVMFRDLDTNMNLQPHNKLILFRLKLSHRQGKWDIVNIISAVTSKWTFRIFTFVYSMK